MTMMAATAKCTVFLVGGLALAAAGLGSAGAQQAPRSTPAARPGLTTATETPKAGGALQENAAKPTPIRVRGSVKRMIDGGIVLADRKGAEVTLFVEPTSILKRRSQEGEASGGEKKWVEIALKDLRVGDALVVQYVEESGKKLVRTLRAQASPAEGGARGGTAPKP
jgi:hypothetical protein